MQEAYQRARDWLMGLRENSLIKNDQPKINWLEDQEAFWYQREKEGEVEYSLVDLAQKTRTVLPDNSELLTIPQSPLNELPSPDGQAIAFTRDHNLWLRDSESGREKQLTTDGEEHNSYAACTAAWGFIFPGWQSLQAQWSPDSQTLLTLQRDTRDVKTQAKVDYIPDSGELRAEVIEESYGMAGDKQGGVYRLLAIDIKQGKILWADYPPIAQDANYGLSYFNSFAESRGWWRGDSTTAYLINYQRDNKQRSVVAFNTKTGDTNAVFTETTDTAFRLHAVGHYKALTSTDELLWTSDTDGWAHLYLYDLQTGSLKRQLTQGEWVVREILHVDNNRREVFLTVSGRVEGRDPYYREIVRVNLDSGELTVIASSNHDYYNATVASSGNFIVATRSRIDDCPVTLAFDRNGEQVMEVEVANLSNLPNNWPWPEPVKMIAADGITDIYGAIFRPSNFDPNKHYPVLEYTFYAATESLNTPKQAFTAVFDNVYQDIISYAELGMIVVTIDGRGTVYRGKDFLDNSYGWSPSVSNIDDRVAGIQQLAERYPYMDLSRIGITGVRGATQTLYALLEKPEFYKVAVLPEMHDSQLIQSCTVALNEDINQDPSKNPRHYQHNLHKLKGKLLIRHGMIDIFNTVGGAFRLIHALEKANKDFEMLIMPKQEVLPSDYTIRRTWDFLVKHLIGQQPPKEFNLSTPT